MTCIGKEDGEVGYGILGFGLDFDEVRLYGKWDLWLFYGGDDAGMKQNH